MSDKEEVKGVEGTFNSVIEGENMYLVEDHVV